MCCMFKSFRFQGKSGLFSLLPAPKNATTKEVGRVLIPHSLQKKGNTTTNSLPKKAPAHAVAKPASLSGVRDRDDSDDEDGDSVNFFSLGDKDTHTGPIPGPSVSNISVPRSTVSSVEPMHEPSLRGPWLGPALPTSDLLGPSSLGPAGPSLPSHSNSTPYDMNQTAAATSDSYNAEGPLYTPEYPPEYAQVRLLCLSVFRCRSYWQCVKRNRFCDFCTFYHH